MRNLTRETFRMAYPAHHRTSVEWGEAIWTAPDLLLASSQMLRLARSAALIATSGISVGDLRRRRTTISPFEERR